MSAFDLPPVSPPGTQESYTRKKGIKDLGALDQGSRQRRQVLVFTNKVLESSNHMRGRIVHTTANLLSTTWNTLYHHLLTCQALSHPVSSPQSWGTSWNGYSVLSTTPGPSRERQASPRTQQATGLGPQLRSANSELRVLSK